MVNKNIILNNYIICLLIIFIFCMSGCVDGSVISSSLSEEPYCTYDIKGICVHEYSYPDNRFCTYDVGGICVWKRDRAIKLNIDMLIDSIIATEVYVNGFYYGLDFFQLATDENFTLQYRLAQNNQYRGTYSFSEAKIWVRQGDNITRHITCMDIYFVAMHELLHFVDDKFVMCEDQDCNNHNTPHLFNQWELKQSTEEERNYIQSNTVEGLIYYYLSNRCGY